MLSRLSFEKRIVCFESICITFGDHKVRKFRFMESISSKISCGVTSLYCIVGIVRFEEITGSKERVDQCTFVILREWVLENNQENVIIHEPMKMNLSDEVMCVDVTFLLRSYTIPCKFSDESLDTSHQLHHGFSYLFEGSMEGVLHTFVLGNPFRHDNDSVTALEMKWRQSSIFHCPWVRPLDVDEAERYEGWMRIRDRLRVVNWKETLIHGISDSIVLLQCIRSIEKPYYVCHIAVEFVKNVGGSILSDAMRWDLPPPISSAFQRKDFSKAEKRRRQSRENQHVIDVVDAMLVWIMEKSNVSPVVVVSLQGEKDFQLLLREISIETGIQNSDITITSLFFIQSALICSLREVRSSIPKGKQLVSLQCFDSIECFSHKGNDSWMKPQSWRAMY